MMRYYRRDGTPYEAGPLEWAASFEAEDRTVKQQRLWNGLFVSTVFLGLNHQWGNGPPLIFETMVFPSEWWSDYYQDRYSTEAEALAGHRRAVRRFLWWPIWLIPLAAKRLWHTAQWRKETGRG